MKRRWAEVQTQERAGVEGVEGFQDTYGKGDVRT